jgi:hypothetical protein
MWQGHQKFCFQSGCDTPIRQTKTDSIRWNSVLENATLLPVNILDVSVLVVDLFEFLAYKVLHWQAVQRNTHNLA